MLQYLLSPTFQIINSAGKPATGGYLEVYLHGTRTKYYCASDFDGTLLPFKIPLNALGCNIVLADDSQSYDVYAYNRYGAMLMSRSNVTPKCGGGISTQEITSADGSVTITDTANGVNLSVPQQVNADWDSTQGASEILNKPDLSIYAEKSELATVATTGSFDDLLDKPEIPPPQVNADWDAESGVARILNRPDLSAYATTLAVDVALERKQDKLVAGPNIQISENNVISATDTTYSAGTGIVITSDTINVENPLPAATPAESNKYLKVDSDGNPTWADPSYWEATSTVSGIVKTGDDTVQVLPKNSPSRNKHRSYPVQKNADEQMVVNVPWKDGSVERYKGFVTLVIQGACVDTTDPVTGVASQVVSDTFADAEIFPYGDNQITSIVYREVEGKPADFRPEFHIDTQGHLYYTFGEESQEWLLFDMIVHFDTMQGFDYFNDGVVEFVANSALVPQPLMAINQRIPVKKTVDGVGDKILDSGLFLVVPKSNNIGSGYNIVLRAEYWYTSSQPEFLVFDAVDNEGDNMVDDEGDHMIFCEDNPNYTGE